MRQVRRREDIGVVRRIPVERDAAAQRAVVEEDSPCSAVAGSSTRYGSRGVDGLGGLPGREDGIAHATLRRECASVS